MVIQKKHLDLNHAGLFKKDICKVVNLYYLKSLFTMVQSFFSNLNFFFINLYNLLH